MDEFEMLQRPFLLRHDDDPGAMRQAGQRGGRLLQRLRQALAARRAQALDVLALVLCEIADLQEAVDKEAQPGLGRQPPGRSVRRIEQPRLFEIRHDVADRRRRQMLPQQPRQGTRADRFAGRDITIDDQPKDLAAALAQFADRRWCRQFRPTLAVFHVFAPRLIRKPRPRSKCWFMFSIDPSPRSRNLGMRPPSVNSRNGLMPAGPVTAGLSYAAGARR